MELEDREAPSPPYGQAFDRAYDDLVGNWGRYRRLFEDSLRRAG